MLAPDQRVTVVDGATRTTLYTAKDIAALKGRREELSNQLSSADGRRRRLQESLRRADGADKAGLEQRLKVLDARIAGLEADIADNGAKLASPEAQSVTTGLAWSPASGNRIRANETPIAILVTLFVLSPIALSFSRLMWRRGTLRPRPEMSEPDPRLERIEQAIDAISIEIERVSEGQRFVTRLLSESRPAVAIGGQPAKEPLRAGAQESIPTPR
ncbi:MAG: hypothetical protein JWN53_420 [Gemmatimonadetes bacterium]|nr:hypothetical protein [Gemmatimonadota bacterium]